MKLNVSRQIIEKYSNMKFNENIFSGSRVIACGQKDGRKDRQTDMKNLTVAFRSFENVPENWLWNGKCK